MVIKKPNIFLFDFYLLFLSYSSSSITFDIESNDHHVDKVHVKREQREREKKQHIASKKMHLTLLYFRNMLSYSNTLQMDVKMFCMHLRPQIFFQQC